MGPVVRAAVTAIVWIAVAGPSPVAKPPTAFSFPAGDRVLDGDTLLVRGASIKIAGIDAPELGPWAKCWAEAALAGQAKGYVERELSEGSWTLVGVAPDANGGQSARLVRADGEDLGDLLEVYGFAATTNGRWDWCGTNANLHSPTEKEGPPRGPNLWWPTGPVFDPRASD